MKAIRAVIPWLREHIREADDLGLQVACASGLGKLGVVEATMDLLSLLRTAPDRSSQREVGLAVARLLGAEVRYIQLSRSFTADIATSMALESDALRARARRSARRKLGLEDQLIEARDKFAGAGFAAGLEPFLRVVDSLADSAWPTHCTEILAESSARLRQYGAHRLEYAVLAVLAMERCGSSRPDRR